VQRDENGVIISSYRWPDCVNPDDDGDGIEDACEQKYQCQGQDDIERDTCFDPHDPSDDPAGDPDGDSYTNLEECQNQTDPFTPEVRGFALTLSDIKSGKPIGEWLPEFEGVLKLEIEWIGMDPAPAIKVNLDSSRYAGRAVNDPDPAATVTKYLPWYVDQFNGFDFGLTQSDPTLNANEHSFSQELDEVAANAGVYTVYLQSWDYGGHTRVIVTVADDPGSRAEIQVPAGSGGTGIGSAWIHDNAAQRLDPNADIDQIVFDKQSYAVSAGDDFNNFDEYRGIIFTPTVGAQRMHKRLNPYRKDLFVRAVGYDPLSAPFALGKAFENAGIDIHDTTDWGHDATEPYNSTDGRFFVYYKSGSITNIAGDKVTGDEDTGWAQHWPKRE